MSNLTILLKNNFNILIGQLSGKKRQKSTTTATLILILGIIGIFALYTLQAYSMLDGLSKLGLEKVCIFHAILTTLAVICIIGIMRTSANQKTNDADFLLSLPIKKRDIVISKTINKYLFDFFFAFTLFVPFLALYQVYTGFDVQVTLLGTLFVLLCPLLSVGISYICDFVVSRLFNKIKYGGLLKSFVIMLLFIAIMALLLLKTFTYGTADFANLDAYFADRPITNTVLNYLFAPNIVNVLVVILGTTIPFAVGLYLYSINFGKTFASYAAKDKALKFPEQSKSFKLLYKKEFSTYATTPAYFINTIIGPIILLVLSVFLSVTGYAGLCDYLSATISKDAIAGLIALIFCGLCATAPISASSISLEGKRIWLLKSSPINERELFASKVCVHLSIVQPCIVVGATLVTAFLGLSFLQALAVFVLPTLVNLLLAFGGLLINLWQPVLEWDNETKVIKQSLAVLLTMLFGLALTVAPYGIYKLCATLPLYLTLVITVALYLVVLTLVVLLLFTRGVKMFRKLEQ